MLLQKFYGCESAIYSVSIEHFSYRPVCPRHFVLIESYNVEWKLLEFG